MFKRSRMKWIAGCFLLLGVTTTYAQTRNHIGLVDKNSQPQYKVHAVLSTETQTILSSAMPGYIEKLYVKEGSMFKKGDVLVQFDCGKRDATLDKARAQVRLAKINFQAHKRLEALGSASHVSVAESEAQHKDALAEEKIAQENVEDCQIVAPFNGQVSDRFARQHETVQLHQKLLNILNNDDLTVEIIAPSTWLSWLKIGTPFVMTLQETGKSYEGKVLRIIHRVDAVSRSAKLIGKLVNEPANLRSGMSGEVEFRRAMHE